MKAHSFPAALIQNPRKLFLLDGLGGLLTAFCLLFILMPFEYQFGMPRQILSILTAVAFVFAIYSVSCFLFVRTDRRLFLKFLYVANLTYCCITAILVSTNYHRLTWLGITYFLIEIVVICMLVAIERRTVLNMSNVRD